MELEQKIKLLEKSLDYLENASDMTIEAGKLICSFDGHFIGVVGNPFKKVCDLIILEQKAIKATVKMLRDSEINSKPKIMVLNEQQTAYLNTHKEKIVMEESIKGNSGFNLDGELL